MAAPLELTEPRALEDLATLIGRLAGHAKDAVRLQGFGGIVLVTIAVEAPDSLFDVTPTVLVCRAFRTGDAAYDAVVPMAALREALASALRDQATIELPDRVGVIPAWAAQSPPRSDWTQDGALDVTAVRGAAAEARSRLAAALPSGLGELRATPIRRDVLAETSPGFGVLFGAALAADAAGFLANEVPVARFTAGRWTRFAYPAGDVLVKAP